MHTARCHASTRCCSASSVNCVVGVACRQSASLARQLDPHPSSSRAAFTFDLSAMAQRVFGACFTCKAHATATTRRRHYTCGSVPRGRTTQGLSEGVANLQCCQTQLIILKVLRGRAAAIILIYLHLLYIVACVCRGSTCMRRRMARLCWLGNCEESIHVRRHCPQALGTGVACVHMTATRGKRQRHRHGCTTVGRTRAKPHHILSKRLGRAKGHKAQHVGVRRPGRHLAAHPVCPATQLVCEPESEPAIRDVRCRGVSVLGPLGDVVVTKSDTGRSAVSSLLSAK